jgi:hypothetical protein
MATAETLNQTSIGYENCGESAFQAWRIIQKHDVMRVSLQRLEEGGLYNASGYG